MNRHPLQILKQLLLACAWLGLFFLRTGSAQQQSAAFEAISREVTAINLGRTQAGPEAVSRELSVFFLGAENYPFTDAVSREISAFAKPGDPPVPVINGPPSPVVPLGERVVLSVSASGTPPFQYQWRFNGQNIAGASGPTYIIPSMRLADAGSYRCVMVNDYGGAYSDQIDLQVPMSELFLADEFGARPVFFEAARQGTTINASASFEAGEPNHAGKQGGRSLWLGWRAPATGVATFSTVGSGFDTLLAVYTGSTLGTLTYIAANEDSGGFFTSRLQFNAVAGTEYQVAVDGFAGASGRLVLSWEMQPGTTALPTIISSPQSRTLTPGASASLRVLVESAGAVTYRWLLNDLAIPGATTDTIDLSNFSAAQVGTYRAEVTSGNFSVVSDPATIELSAVSQAVTQDKLEDLLPAAGPGAAPGREAASSFPIVSAGVFGSQNINSFGATTQFGEPIHGSVPNGASRWFKLTAAENGTFIIDTIGSDIDTVLAVYTGSNLLNLQLVDKDDNSAPDGLRSLVRFPAVAGTSYLIAAAGLNNAQGNIVLNWKLGHPARVVTAPLSQSICLGDPFTLSSLATGAPAPNYQWFFKGVALRAQTRPTLQRDSVREDQFGVYTVVAFNDFGSDTAQAAITMTPCQLLRFDPTAPPRVVNGFFELQIIGSESGKSIVIQFSNDLIGWTTVHTTASGGITKFSEKLEGQARFYRALQQ